MRYISATKQRVYEEIQAVADGHPFNDSDPFTGAAAEAMSFSQFDGMAAKDRFDYINFMISAAQQTLTSQGRPDLATKVNDLFTKPRNPGDQISFGWAVFEESLTSARVHDAKNPDSNPVAQRVQLEVVMAGTLKNLGIETSPEFLRGFAQISTTFQPKFTAQQQTAAH